MEVKDYELILKALDVYTASDDEKEILEKLVKKINLFVESDKLRNEYQDNMQKINDKLTELFKESDKKAK